MIRRLTATVLSGLFTAHLLLAGASNLCSVSDHAPAASDNAAAAALGASDMAGMPMDDQAPCDHPVSPEQCQTMAPCASAFVVVSMPDERSVGEHLSVVVAALISVPRSVSFTPEPPPPRA